MNTSNTSFPVVDLFAGPGGLGEGFAVNANQAFSLVLSIEKDEATYQTLLLRHFFHLLCEADKSNDYFEYLGGGLEKNELIERHNAEWLAANNLAKKIALGEGSHTEVKSLIRNKLKGSKKWVLVGGPPCQAYSLVGRSRMKALPGFEADERHFLYKEYLKIIIDHRPPVFVMENVKGLLSAKVNGKSVFNQVLEDLRNPVKAISKESNVLRYRLYSLSCEGEMREGRDVKDFIVRSEEYGVPQARHRVFILGVRDDIQITPAVLKKEYPINIDQAIGDLPKIRSRISRREDSISEWKNAILELEHEVNRIPQSNVRSSMRNAIRKIRRSRLSSSSDSYSHPPKLTHSWFYDSRLKGITCHQARSHMVSDLHRYFYAACFSEAMDVSPKLVNFPEFLLPKHKNVEVGRLGKMFSDRFRVQVKSRPSTTITSHISKDGHYFIHYDPSQCRSLTVREAARLQTFPDNYHFEGNRTEQYHQVGNAVPPYLAQKISCVVQDVLKQL